MSSLGGISKSTRLMFFLSNSVKQFKKLYIFAAENKIEKMAKDYFTKGIKKQEVNEPRAQYVASVQDAFRVVDEDELAECITLEEWESELTTIIHEHYQSNHESHSQSHCKN